MYSQVPKTETDVKSFNNITVIHPSDFVIMCAMGLGYELWLVYYIL